MLMLYAVLGLNAQNPTATVVGTVTDASGGAVVAAQFDVRNVETNDVRQVHSDAK
jgi:hypothetical protein